MKQVELQGDLRELHGAAVKGILIAYYLNVLSFFFLTRRVSYQLTFLFENIRINLILQIIAHAKSKKRN